MKKKKRKKKKMKKRVKKRKKIRKEEEQSTDMEIKRRKERLCKTAEKASVREARVRERKRAS